MHHCHTNACPVAYCDDVVTAERETRTPAWHKVLTAMLDAVNRLHHYRNLRARMFAQGMHRFDCEDRS